MRSTSLQARCIKKNFCGVMSRRIIFSHIVRNSGVCKKSFNLSGTLKLHLRTHTGCQPFKCDVCKKSFKPWSIIYPLILGSGRLHVMYVRNLSISQVLWNCIGAFIPGNGHLHLTYVRFLSRFLVTWSCICTLIRGSGHLSVMYVTNLSVIQILWSCIFALILARGRLHVTYVRCLSRC